MIWTLPPLKHVSAVVATLTWLLVPDPATQYSPRLSKGSCTSCPLYCWGPLRVVPEIVVSQQKALKGASKSPW